MVKTDGYLLNAISQKQLFVVSLGLMGQLMVALWKVKPMILDSAGKETLCFVVGSGDGGYSNDLPTWVSPIDIDSFDAVPTKTVAPINVWLRNGKRKALHHGVVFMQDGDEIPLMVLAAQKCFYNLAKHPLKTLCVEHDVVPTTPDLLGHLEVLIQTILPDLTPQEVNEILFLRCELKDDPISEFLQNPAVAEVMFPNEDQKVLEDSNFPKLILKCFVFWL